MNDRNRDKHGFQVCCHDTLVTCVDPIQDSLVILVEYEHNEDFYVIIGIVQMVW